MVTGIEDTVRMLRRALGNLFPVFPAESTENLGGEFVRDLLSKRFSPWIALLTIVALGGLAWWSSR